MMLLYALRAERARALALAAEPCRWWHAFGVWRHLVCLTHGEGIHEDRAFIRSTPHEVGMPLEACRYNHD